MGLRYHPHMYIECIPVEKETGDLAPIYFKVIMFNIDSLLIMFINASVFKNFVHCVQLNRLKCLKHLGYFFLNPFTESDTGI